jgi:hypothetical protein
MDMISLQGKQFLWKESSWISKSGVMNTDGEAQKYLLTLILFLEAKLSCKVNWDLVFRREKL